MKLLFFVSICSLAHFIIHSDGYVLKSPEFLEPVKNISAPIGGNVEFSCLINNVGNHRVLWMKKEEGTTGVLIGVNELKITKNPRITLSLLQKSKDVTQSNLYIYAIQKEDLGLYECAINTSPTISQIGSLEELKEELKYEIIPKLEGGHSASILPPHLKANPVLKPFEDQQDNPGQDILIPQSPPYTLISNASQSLINFSEESKIICLDLPKIWQSTKKNVNEVISSVSSFLSRSFKKLTSQFFDDNE